MPDDTLPVAEPSPLDAPPSAPPREAVVMHQTTAAEPDESPAERTLATKATRLTLDEAEHDELVKLVDQVLENIQRERDEGEWDANWDLWEDIYFGVLQDRPAGQSNVHVPLSQEVVDTFLAVTEQVFFTAHPWLQIMPREAMDVDTAKRKEQHLDYALNVEMKAKERYDTLIWEMLTLNTGVAYLPWLREMDRIRDEEVYDGQKLEDMERFEERYPRADEDFPEIVAKLRKGKRVRLQVEYDEPIHDAPDLQHLPLRDWLPGGPPHNHPPPRERVRRQGVPGR